MSSINYFNDDQKTKLKQTAHHFYKTRDTAGGIPALEAASPRSGQMPPCTWHWMLASTERQFLSFPHNRNRGHGPVWTSKHEHRAANAHPLPYLFSSQSHKRTKEQEMLNLASNTPSTLSKQHEMDTWDTRGMGVEQPHPGFVKKESSQG